MNLNGITVYTMNAKKALTYIAYFDTAGERESFINKNERYLGKTHNGAKIVLKKVAGYKNQELVERYPLIIA